MKNVLRGTLVAGAALAACVGFGTPASAVDADRVEVPDAAELPVADWPELEGESEIEILSDILNDVLNDNEILSDNDIDILNDSCLLPWFWQGPLSIGLLGGGNGDYTACNEAVTELEADGKGAGLGILGTLFGN